MNKKLLTLGLTGALVLGTVGAVSAETMTSTGNTNVTFTGGTVGPVDALWAVSMPLNVELSASNNINYATLGEDGANMNGEHYAKGQKMKFTVYDAFGNTESHTGNQEITVTADMTGATKGVINMEAQGAASSRDAGVTMGLIKTDKTAATTWDLVGKTDAGNNSAVFKLNNQTPDSGSNKEHTRELSAVVLGITNPDKLMKGDTYTKTLNFTFSSSQK